jgi:hypothetical protein
MNCASEQDLAGEEFYTQIKKVATIKRVDTKGNETIYCFSCYDISGQINKNIFTLANGMQINLTSDELDYLEDFFRENNCQQDLEEEIVITKHLTEEDTKPYIRKLGVLDAAMMYTYNFRTNYGYGDEQRTTNLLQFVKEYTAKFFNLKQIELPRDLDFNNIQMSMKTSVIHDAAIEYYQRLYAYLNEKGLYEEYKHSTGDLMFEESKTLKVLVQDGGALIIQKINIEDVEENPGELNLSEMDIVSLEYAKIPEHIFKLDLSGNSLDTLKHIPQFITHLNVQGNNIKNFEGCPPNLIDLDISINPIANLDHIPRQLKRLSIFCDNIKKDLPRNLETLKLINSKIDSLSDLPRSLKILYLKNVTVKNKKLEGIPQNLEYLYFRYINFNDFEHIPVSLEQLGIEDSNLPEIPQSFKNLINLRNLRINGCKLSKIDNLPPNLSSLVLPNNKIKTIENLPQKLEYLNLDYNYDISKIENIPRTLKSFEARSTDIEEIQNLPNTLEILDLSGTKIQVVHNLPQELVNLYLSSTKIHKLKSLPSTIKYIDISDINNIVELWNVELDKTEIVHDNTKIALMYGD